MDDVFKISDDAMRSTSDERPATETLGFLGAMRDSADLLDEIVADAMIDRQMQAWRPSQKDFAALASLAAAPGRSLPDLLNEALRDFLSRHGQQPDPIDRSETPG